MSAIFDYRLVHTSLSANRRGSTQLNIWTRFSCIDALAVPGGTFGASDQMWIRDVGYLVAGESENTSNPR